jgi:hypothetical protein
MNACQFLTTSGFKSQRLSNFIAYISQSTLEGMMESYIMNGWITFVKPPRLAVYLWGPATTEKRHWFWAVLKLDKYLGRQWVSQLRLSLCNARILRTTSNSCRSQVLCTSPWIHHLRHTLWSCQTVTQKRLSWKNYSKSWSYLGELLTPKQHNCDNLDRDSKSRDTNEFVQLLSGRYLTILMFLLCPWWSSILYQRLWFW